MLRAYYCKRITASRVPGADYDKQIAKNLDFPDEVLRAYHCESGTTNRLLETFSSTEYERTTASRVPRADIMSRRIPSYTFTNTLTMSIGRIPIHAQIFWDAITINDAIDQKEFLKTKLKDCPTSRSQVDSLGRLLGRTALANAFYALKEFAGLWSGFQHGNLSALVALRCDEVSSAIAIQQQAFH